MIKDNVFVECLVIMLSIIAGICKRTAKVKIDERPPFRSRCILRAMAKTKVYLQQLKAPKALVFERSDAKTDASRLAGLAGLAA